MEWPSCSNCRYAGEQACDYMPSQRWSLTPAANLKMMPCCGYWHGANGETRRERCKSLNRLLDGTRPPT